MDYNSKTYIELLRYAQSLRKNVKNLEEQDKVKYSKLLNYSVKLSDHVHWQKKSEYLNLMKNFVNLKIDGKQFLCQFRKIHGTNEKTVKMLQTNLEQLKTFQPNPESFGFTEWTSEIDLGCDEFYPDFEPQDQISFAFARDEENFRNFIANIIPQIEKYF